MTRQHITEKSLKAVIHNLRLLILIPLYLMASLNGHAIAIGASDQASSYWWTENKASSFGAFTDMILVILLKLPLISTLLQ